jgi:hypothetical protein
LNSVAHSPGTPANSGPVSGVHAMAKAQAAIRPHMPAEAATERQNWPAGASVLAVTAATPPGFSAPVMPSEPALLPGPGSAAAHASATAMAIPVQNQISSGGSVPSDHRLGWG